MCAFVAINKAPGVYIDEVDVPGPIAGVGTSTAAFVGPARSGPLLTPTRLSKWTDFVDTFGAGGPYIAQPRIYVALAVQGFFENGGADCWFVRVGTAARATVTLQDRSNPANDTLVVTAKREGSQANGTTVAVSDASLGSTTVVDANAASAAIAQAQNATATAANAADAAKFVKGDVVRLDDGNQSEQATIDSISAATITFTANLANAFGAGTTMRPADLVAGATVLRVAATANIEVGSNVEISQGGQSETHVVAAVDAQARRITLDAGLTQGYNLDGTTAVDVDTREFSLLIEGSEAWNGLSMDPRHSRYFGVAVTSATVTVTAADDPPNPARPPDDMPAVTGANPPTLANGADDNPAAVPRAAYKAGIDTLRKVDEVNNLCVPDQSNADVQGYMIAHCELMQDRFAILDPLPQVGAADIVTQRNALGSDNGYAALYFPRLIVADPLVDGARIAVPPSGHLAGIYARVDNEQGVFTAPANQIVRGTLDLEHVLDEGEQGPLNEQGINVIRSFPGRGAVVWGARTISQSTQWRYIPVRRFVLFVEESLVEGTRFVVFKPNTPALRGQLVRTVTEFLTRQWVAGALVGATPDQAFSVRSDDALNPPDTVALGQVVVEVQMGPAPPAEFIVFRIIQQPGRPVVQE